MNFCPYCGTAQVDEAARTQGHAGTLPAGPAAPPPVHAGPTGPAGQAPAQDGPGLVVRAAEAAEAAEAAGAAPTDPAAWGHRPGNAATTRPSPPPLPPLPPLPSVPPLPPPSPPPPPSGARPQAAGAGPMPAAPPKRDPVRLRWWILALAALWGIWLLAKPSTRRIEAQMDKAIALAQECKPRDAQTELIALRKTKATPEQLQRVQKALNDAAGMCTRKRQRDKAWREAKSGVQAALASSSVERARQRLRTFTRRWGEDDQTRALKEEIDARQPEHPRADEVEGGMMR
ncbi:MAG: hypothetical protein ABWY02_05160 [Telluria sp.]